MRPNEQMTTKAACCPFAMRTTPVVVWISDVRVSSTHWIINKGFELAQEITLASDPYELPFANPASAKRDMWPAPERDLGQRRRCIGLWRLTAAALANEWDQTWRILMVLKGAAQRISSNSIRPIRNTDAPPKVPASRAPPAARR